MAGHSLLHNLWSVFLVHGSLNIFQNPPLLPCFYFLVRIHLFGFYISGEGVELVIVGALGELFQRKSGKKSFQRRRVRLFHKIQNQISIAKSDWSLKKGSNICKDCQTKTGKWIFKGEEKWKVYLTGHNQNLVDYPTQLICTWIFICVPWQS